MDSNTQKITPTNRTKTVKNPQDAQSGRAFSSQNNNVLEGGVSQNNEEVEGQSNKNQDKKTTIPAKFLETLTPNNQYRAATEPLMDVYLHMQKKPRKALNQKKYNMSQNSVLYKFSIKHLQNLMIRYPSEFPAELSTQIKTYMRMRARFSSIFQVLLVGGILNFVAVRGKSWFRMTGSLFKQAYWFLGNLFMVEILNNKTYLAEKVFLNHKYFEDVVDKYSLSPNETIDKKISLVDL